jgi:hypothetical protein
MFTFLLPLNHKFVNALLEAMHVVSEGCLFHTLKLQMLPVVSQLAGVNVFWMVEVSVPVAQLIN